MILSAKKTPRVLLIGYSYLAQKAIIPALEKSKIIDLVGIASRSKFTQIPNKFAKFNNYEEAINKSGCNAIYISVENSSHYQWIQYALKKGLHVICDKPAVMSQKEALKCFYLASDKLLLFESIPYLHHPQHQLIKDLLKKQKGQIKSINMSFGFPLLDSKNFRNFPQFGGGCIWDLGPYAASLGKYYFGKNPVTVYSQAFVNRGIPESATITMHFADNQVLQALIGFSYEYRNNIQLWGSDFHFNIDRAFTIPSTFQNVIHHKSHDQISKIKAPKSDAFCEMFSNFAKLFNSKSDYAEVNKSFVDQATIIESINKSARKKKPVLINYKL